MTPLHTPSSGAAGPAFPDQRDLRGRPVPPTTDLDVAHWSGPHSFAVHRREELGGLLAVVLLVVPSRLVSLAGLEYSELLGIQTLASEVFGMVMVMLLPPAVALLAFRTQVPRRGWVTIDPASGRIELRDARRQGSSIRGSWAIGEVPVVAFSDGRTSIDSLASGTVTLELPDRDLMVRVPTGHGKALAESLTRVAAPREPARTPRS